MVIIDEKAVPPPPYYASSDPSAPPPFPARSSRQSSIYSLPPNVLLQIIYLTFPRTPDLERQRKTLYWLAYRLRLVNHAFYIACMHVLRSTYLPAYSSLIRSSYSSDPFPMSSTTSSTPLDPVQRETRVLDLFIAIKTKEDLFMDASELHLGRDELFKDLFDLMQPRSRLEDLVRHYGTREGVVHVTSTNGIGSSSTTSLNSVSSGSIRSQNRTSLPFSALSVVFSPRKVGLTLTASGRKRTIVELQRIPNEKLEAVAKKLVKQLKVWLNVP
ncbi:hypothetical protein EDD16DRAFT_1486517 [Pisolithus croceorrhizus]|nr:hypothetical protein EDD16DRAFT_1486517 [Pisolithus croceorrhizus]KAI6111888.1 hypothetical protein EV401DRAFT_1987728 [Pisolithus croceorrhizus]KAI6163955.1 hypothetical protein EDD17DRAFT_406512 [Pisolithus thermaeus]